MPNPDDKPDLKKIGQEMPNFVRMMFLNSCPYPDRSYCEKVGWLVNEDGTVDTPGGFKIPTRELYEVRELERLYEK
jgi:hypothetical protein